VCAPLRYSAIFHPFFRPLYRIWLAKAIPPKGEGFPPVSRSNKYLDRSLLTATVTYDNLSFFE